MWSYKHTHTHTQANAHAQTQGHTLTRTLFSLVHVVHQRQSNMNKYMSSGGIRRAD